MARIETAGRRPAVPQVAKVGATGQTEQDLHQRQPAQEQSHVNISEAARALSVLFEGQYAVGQSIAIATVTTGAPLTVTIERHQVGQDQAIVYARAQEGTLYAITITPAGDIVDVQKSE